MMTPEAFSRLSTNGKYRAIRMEHDRANMNEQRAPDLKRAAIMRHLKSVLTDIIKDLSVDEFDDLLNIRIKQDSKN